MTMSLSRVSCWSCDGELQLHQLSVNEVESVQAWFSKESFLFDEVSLPRQSTLYSKEKQGLFDVWAVPP